MLYGRDQERAVIGALLEAARASRSGALVLRGEPGIGKSALLDDTRDRAGDMHVLAASGVESEAELPFAAVHQLVRPALGHVERLPTPQAAALGCAFGLADGRTPEPFLVFSACLSLLSELAERRPVLCLVDDAHWLDAASADALRFVARRLDAEGIVVLFAAREGDVRSFDAPAIPSQLLGGLDAEAAAAVLTRGVRGALAPSVRRFLVEQADGNALALVELPAALTGAQLGGDEPLPDAAPLTRDIERLFLERVRRLPEPTQQLLSFVAADATGSLAPVLRAAQAAGIAADALTPAERAGLVSVRGSTVVVRHPLVRSAIYQGSSSSERRAAHLALADALTGELEADQRSWHRAAAALGPDADVADGLESTADRARLRGGYAAAASALQRAGELSVDAESQARRWVAAASAAWHAGQPERASALLDRADPPVTDWRLRSDAEHLRGVIQLRCGVLVDACDTLMASAAEVAPFDTRKALEMLLEAREAAGWAGDTPRTVEADRRAAALPRGEDRESRFLADLIVGVGSVYEGRTAVGTQLVLDAIAAADDIDEPGWLAWAAMGARAVGDEAKEAELMRRAIALARASGAVDKLTYVLLAHVLAGLLAARFGVVAEATEGLTLAREAGLPNAASTHMAMLAWFAGARGHEEECLAHSDQAKELAKVHGAGFASSIAEWGVGILELGRGRADEAVARLAAVADPRPGIGHPYFALMSAPDLVEAHARAGRRELAEDAFAVFQGFAQPSAPAWARALAARCRAVLSEDDSAEEAFTEALLLHEEAGRTFDRARTALLCGEQLRRQRRRREARAHLRGALDAFEGMGTTLWAERARSELRASGETARKRDPSTLGQLTPQELQIARFVADGLSNKEVAAQMFLSPRTIESHLRSVFSKLAITSRTQLARLQLDDALPGVDMGATPARA